MAKNTGKVREKSGNFVSPEKWEPCDSRCPNLLYALLVLLPSNVTSTDFSKH